MTHVNQRKMQCIASTWMPKRATGRVITLEVVRVDGGKRIIDTDQSPCVNARDRTFFHLSFFLLRQKPVCFDPTSRCALCRKTTTPLALYKEVLSHSWRPRTPCTRIRTRRLAKTASIVQGRNFCTYPNLLVRQFVVMTNINFKTNKQSPHYFFDVILLSRQLQNMTLP